MAMHLFRMKGAWGGLSARLFDVVIARGVAPMHRRIAAEAAPRLPRAGRFLDVGCGAGHTATALADCLPEARILGVDLSDTMIGLAQANARGRGNLEFRVADAMALPFGDGEFDGAYSIASIKHWPDESRGVAEMARVVRPGGTVLVVEADRDCTAESVRRFVAMWRFRVPMTGPIIVRYFRSIVARQGVDADSLRRWMESAGLLEVVVVRDTDMPGVYAVGRRA